MDWAPQHDQRLLLRRRIEVLNEYTPKVVVDRPEDDVARHAMLGIIIKGTDMCLIRCAFELVIVGVRAGYAMFG